jgi:hypothetical protein
VAHLDDLDTEPLGLRAAVAIEGADADLDEAHGMAGFHDPGKGRGVGERVALEIVVEVGMCVEMEDVDRTRGARHRRDRRKADRVVAAEKERDAPLRHRRGDRGADQIVVALTLAQGQVARILEQHVLAEFDSVFGGEVGVIRRQSGANCRRRGRGAAQEGGVAIGRRADQADYRLLHRSSNAPA